MAGRGSSGRQPCGEHWAQCFPPASLLSRQAKLFCAVVDVKPSPCCLRFFSPKTPRALNLQPQRSQKKKSSAGSGWKMDQGVNSRREGRVKLVIFLAHGCNYSQCIPEAFLWILCRSACRPWERGRKREEKSLLLGDNVCISNPLLRYVGFFAVARFLFNQTSTSLLWDSFLVSWRKGVCKEETFMENCNVSGVWVLSFSGRFMGRLTARDHQLSRLILKSVDQTDSFKCVFVV